jgi:hypothetical protein
MDERAVGFNPRTLGDGLVYGANGDVQAFGRGPKTPGQHKTHERNVHAKGIDSTHSAVENGNGEGSAPTPGATDGEKKVPNEALLDKFRTDGECSSSSPSTLLHLLLLSSSSSCLHHLS